MRLKLLVEFEVRESEVDAFVEILRAAVPVMEQVDGCESVEVLLNLDTPNTVALSEVWSSREQHDRYAEAKRESGSVDAMASRIVAPPKMTFYAIK